MPAEQGGTPGLDNVGSRSGVPLPLTIPPCQSSYEYDPEYARMESWMDENPEFLQDYFIRKATRQVVDSWLVSHANPGSGTELSSPIHGGTQAGSSRGGSGATTPVRKISAHEFERGGLLKPIVNTIDGTPTFLSVGPQNDSAMGSTSSPSGSTSSHSHRPQRLSRNELRHLDEKQLIFELVKDICNELDVRSLCHKILQNVSILLKADRGSLFLVEGKSSDDTNYSINSTKDIAKDGTKVASQDGMKTQIANLANADVSCSNDETNVGASCSKEQPTADDSIVNAANSASSTKEGMTYSSTEISNTKDGSKGVPKEKTKRWLVSKLFDVCPRSTLAEIEQKDEIRVAWGTGIAGYVAESGEPVNIPDAYQDERFNRDIDTHTGYRTKALLCMPIKDASGDVVGVAQVINKLNCERFTENDEKIFASYLQFCGIGLRNAQLYEKSQLEVKRNQVLLDLARMIFEEQSTIEHMVYRILTHMQSLIQCQRVQVLLVHEASKGSFSRVFDFGEEDTRKPLNSETKTESEKKSSPAEPRFPINIGITGHVATTGETVNIPDAYLDTRFDPSVDESKEFKHKSILCMAIKNSLSQIIGVIQLVNKFGNLDFTKNDENFVEAFAIFCGMGIHNTHMYEKAVVAMAKQSVTLEVLSYHASASWDDAQRLRKLKIPSSAYFQLHDFKFDDIFIDDDDTLKACLRMFLELDFVERFNIEYEVLCRWFLSVKKNYRNVTYHNWRHAFNVAQMMFSILMATQWWKVFGEIECLALMIACVCHDLDHRGTNNTFQIKASSPLAQLYSTSTMEHHHFDQCLMILNSPGNQILANLSSEEYSRVIKVLEDAILSTDLAVYFVKRDSFVDLIRPKLQIDWCNEDHRDMLRAMSMTVCDLSAITKPWPIEKRIADLVSSEFFEQGDMELQELKIKPLDIMNRENKSRLPAMQVTFIEKICLPIYQAFAILSDKLTPLRDGVLANYKQWKRLSKEAEEAQLNGADMNTSDEGEATNNNNNNCNEKGAQSDESSNGTIGNDDIPKVVGKLGRIDTNLFIKTNGAITGTFGYECGPSNGGIGTGRRSINNCNENI